MLFWFYKLLLKYSTWDRQARASGAISEKWGLKAVDPLLEALVRYPDNRSYPAIIEALASLGDPKAIDLIGYLAKTEKDEKRREEAIKALGRFSHAGVIPYLCEVMEKGNEAVGTIKGSPVASLVIESLARRMTNAEPASREQANLARGLRSLGWVPKTPVEECMYAIGMKNWSCLATFRAVAVGPLCKILSRERPEHGDRQQEFLAALAGTGDPRAVDAIVDWMIDKDIYRSSNGFWHMLKVAAKALRLSGPDGASRLMERAEMMMPDQHQSVSGVLVEVAAEIGDHRILSHLLRVALGPSMNGFRAAAGLTRLLKGSAQSASEKLLIEIANADFHAVMREMQEGGGGVIGDYEVPSHSVARPYDCSEVNDLARRELARRRARHSASPFDDSAD